MKTTEKDYTNELGFWKRLESFVSDVQTNCCMGEEEKKMIMHNCKLKILDIQHVSNNAVAVCPKCGAEETAFDALLDKSKCMICQHIW